MVFMQSLRHQNTVQDTVHLNMIFEDAAILHSNPLIKTSLRAISRTPNTQQLSNIRKKAFSIFHERLEDLVRTSEYQGTHAAYHVNIAKYALLCLNTMLEAYTPIIKTGESDVRINLLKQEQLEKRGWKLRPNRDDSELDYNTWLVDTDGLIFNKDNNTNQRILSDSDLQTLNAARSVSVRPLRKFFNLSVDSMTSEHRLKSNAYPLFYTGQHPSQFRRRGTHDDPEMHERMRQIWQTSAERRRRIFRNGTDHQVIFLHPYSEILEYATNENIRAEMFKRIIDGVECDPTVVEEQVGCSLLFSKSTAKPPFFAPRTTDQVVNASGKAAASLASRKNGLKFSSPLPRDIFFSNYHPKPKFDLQEWKESCLQSALYFKKYQPSGENGQPQKRVFPWGQKRGQIMTDDDIQALLSTFKYTVRWVKNNQSSETNRQFVWNRPHRCNGVTTIRIDSLPDDERQRVQSLYGSGYGGLKPCERIVRKDMRCADHRQQGPRTPTEFYDSWPS